MSKSNGNASSHGRRRRPMERGFAALPLRTTGHHLGRERFVQDRLPLDFDVPLLNPWRNNLTALSQVHNLYFVACEDVVHVYRPTFPMQRLSALGSLAIILLKSSPHLQGLMPDCNPHSINNLLVADLGHKEVLLCACDDGDVLGFWTDVIETTVIEYSKKETSKDESKMTVKNSGRTVAHDELEMSAQSVFEHLSAAPPNTPCSDDFAVVRLYLQPFFHVNVGFSAWGLAVHTGLRLIAISSNSHCIHVFAHALRSIPSHLLPSRSGLVNSPEHNHDWEMLLSGVDSLLDQRKKNRFRVLREHFTNVPAIAFDNSTCTEGRLVSSDIGGRVITWNVDKGEALQDMFEGSQLPTDHDMWTAGWGVMCLDCRAFARAPGIVEALGHCSTSFLPDVYVVDISTTRLTLPNLSVWQPGHGGVGRYTEDGSQLSVLDSAADLDYEFEDEEPSMHDDLQRPEIARDVGAIKDLLRRNKAGEFFATVIRRTITREWAIRHEASPMFTMTARTYPTEYPKPLLRTPLMIFHPQGVHLLQSHDLCTRDSSSPTIFLNDPLFQPTDNDSLSRVLQRQDRLNLHCQIPEIGVVLVGSPKGRVAVLSLWHLEKNPFLRDTKQTRPGGRSRSGYEESKKIPRSPVYTFRLDHLLPFTEQEDVGLRPMQQLVGLSASPLQGCGGATRDDRGHCSRWRVLLLYRDHTMLSYELSKPPNAALDLMPMGP